MFERSDLSSRINSPTNTRPLLPEAPAVYGTSKHHVPLERGEVKVGVVHFLQSSTPVVNLIAICRSFVIFLLCLRLRLLLLRSLLQHF